MDVSGSPIATATTSRTAVNPKLAARHRLVPVLSYRRHPQRPGGRVRLSQPNKQHVESRATASAPLPNHACQCANFVRPISELLGAGF